MAHWQWRQPHQTIHARRPGPFVGLVATRDSGGRASGGDRAVTPPVEPMLAVAALASVVYLLLWWHWWDVLADEGVELEYVE